MHPLLGDPDSKVIEAYDVLNREATGMQKVLPGRDTSLLMARESSEKSFSRRNTECG